MPESKRTIKKTAWAKKPASGGRAIGQIIAEPGSLTVPELSLSGKPAGSLVLPKELFGARVNTSLLAQAMRVYSTNLQTHWANTKTRGEVAGSTKKIYRQKGTGGARHGSRKAPIFVHFGGVALGPKFRKTVLDLPKKMKSKALVAALSSKVLAGKVMGLADLDKATGKTKQAASLIKPLTRKTVLVVHDQRSENASRAFKNLPGVSFTTAVQLNAYEVLKHQSLLLTREAVAKLENRIKEEEPGTSKIKGKPVSAKKGAEK